MNVLNLDYLRYKLKNGLDVILYQDKNMPIVATNVWYKVGSANERKGKTGLAHLFEHMMFQGSQNVARDMHFKHIQEAGGNLNGSTSFDKTNYYEKVPANFLELTLWLESDRMGFFLPTLTLEKLKNQIDVVKNERLERYDNQPYGLAWELIISNLYSKDHPYSWPTIGSLEDITNYTLDDVIIFFKTHYSPSNASIVVAGNFNVAATKEYIEKYFGDIVSSSLAHTSNCSQASLSENKNIIHKDNVQLERLYLAWHSTKAYSQYDAELDILADILAGSKSSRLYSKLVFKNELAQDITALQFSGKLAGHFIIIATAKPGVTLTALKSEIFKEIDNIQANGVSSRELLKSKNGIKSSFVFSMQKIDTLADQLNHYSFYLDEPNSFNIDLERYNNVTIDGIKNAVDKYFTKPFVQLNIIPKDKELKV